MLVLFNNPGGYGFIELDALQGSTIKGSTTSCADIRMSPFNYLANIDISGLVQPIDYIKAYKCNSDIQQNCGALPPTCTEKALAQNYNTGGLYPISYNSSLPSTPSGLTITSGDRSLIVSWNQVPDPSGQSEVFAYYFTVYDGGTKVIGGYIAAGNRNVTVSNLTNGKSYDIYIVATSHSNVSSSPASGAGTPVAACATPACNFAVG